MLVVVITHTTTNLAASYLIYFKNKLAPLPHAGDDAAGPPNLGGDGEHFPFEDDDHQDLLYGG